MTRIQDPKVTLRQILVREYHKANEAWDLAVQGGDCNKIRACKCYAYAVYDVLDDLGITLTREELR